MGAGRPTTYREEYIGMVDDYLATCVDTPYQLLKSEGNNSQSWENRLRVKLPTIEGYSIYIDTALTTIDSWRAKNPDFSGALDKIAKMQRERLTENGLAGTYNSTIAKLILSANHGMVERKDVTTDGKQLPVPILGSIDVQQDNSN